MTLPETEHTVGGRRHIDKGWKVSTGKGDQGRLDAGWFRLPVTTLFPQQLDAQLASGCTSCSFPAAPTLPPPGTRPTCSSDRRPAWNSSISCPEHQPGAGLAVGLTLQCLPGLDPALSPWACARNTPSARTVLPRSHSYSSSSLSPNICLGFNIFIMCCVYQVLNKCESDAEALKALFSPNVFQRERGQERPQDSFCVPGPRPCGPWQRDGSPTPPAALCRGRLLSDVPGFRSGTVFAGQPVPPRPSWGHVIPGRSQLVPSCEQPSPAEDGTLDAAGQSRASEYLVPGNLRSS